MVSALQLALLSSFVLAAYVQGHPVPSSDHALVVNAVYLLYGRVTFSGSACLHSVCCVTITAQLSYSWGATNPPPLQVQDPITSPELCLNWSQHNQPGDSALPYQLAWPLPSPQIQDSTHEPIGVHVDPLQLMAPGPPSRALPMLLGVDAVVEARSPAVDSRRLVGTRTWLLPAHGYAQELEWDIGQDSSLHWLTPDHPCPPPPPATSPLTTAIIGTPLSSCAGEGCAQPVSQDEPASILTGDSAVSPAGSVPRSDGTPALVKLAFTGSAPVQGLEGGAVAVLPASSTSEATTGIGRANAEAGRPGTVGRRACRLGVSQMDAQPLLEQCLCVHLPAWAGGGGGHHPEHMSPPKSLAVDRHSGTSAAATAAAAAATAAAAAMQQQQQQCAGLSGTQAASKQTGKTSDTQSGTGGDGCNGLKHDRARVAVGQGNPYTFCVPVVVVCGLCLLLGSLTSAAVFAMAGLRARKAAPQTISAPLSNAAGGAPEEARAAQPDVDNPAGAPPGSDTPAWWISRGTENVAPQRRPDEAGEQLGAQVFLPPLQPRTLRHSVAAMAATASDAVLRTPAGKAASAAAAALQDAAMAAMTRSTAGVSTQWARDQNGRLIRSEVEEGEDEGRYNGPTKTELFADVWQAENSG
ncbi:hypothetical protein V8C86DRAFT_2815333 [Haematococcus lacustris]